MFDWSDPTEMTETPELIEATEDPPAARSPSWATHPSDRRLTSPALPEDAISRIADLIEYGIARPGDAGDLRRAAEAVRGLRARVGELEARLREVDGRERDEGEAERLVGEFRAAGI